MREGFREALREALREAVPAPARARPGTRAWLTRSLPQARAHSHCATLLREARVAWLCSRPQAVEA